MTYPASERRAMRRGPVYGGGFIPRHLFRNGEQGTWYDPSDLSTLFQDSAGTTPVTADGDPVGLMLDKSGNGNHATQSTSAARPTYRRGDSRGVVNLLKWSEAFDNAVWGKAGTPAPVVVANQSIAPNGALTADQMTWGAGTAVLQQQVITYTAGNQYTVSVYVKAATGSQTFRLTAFDGVSSYNSTDFTATSEWQRFTHTYTTNNSTPSGTSAIIRDSSNNAGDVYIWGAQLETGSTATPYQRNDSHLGGVATGFNTDLRWLEFDGVDDYLIGGPTHQPAWAVMAAVASTFSGASQVIFGGRSGTLLRSYLAQTNGDAQAGIAGLSNVDNSTPTGAASGQAVVIGYHHNGSELGVLVGDTVDLSKAQTGDTQPGQSAYIGALNNIGTPVSYFSGRVYGIVARSVYPANTQALPAYLATKAGGVTL